MARRIPPVPPEGRSTKGPQGPAAAQADTSVPEPKAQPGNLAEQGEQGNIRQNTTNQGYQQDR